MRGKGKRMAVWTVVCLLGTVPVWSQEPRTPVKPVGPLMMEHRLIERMAAPMALEANRIKEGKPADLIFAGTVVDFFRVYVDGTHQAKEEDILFRALAAKNISAEHRKILETLIADHEQARTQVNKLAETAERLDKGDVEAGSDIREAFHALAGLYPRHIFQEERKFFLPVLDYFSDEEEAQMVRRMADHDSGMIHRKYREVAAEAKERMKK